MSANETRRTKIVATVGPASREPETLRELIDAGVDVFRLNFSHGNAADHAENVERIRAASADLGVEIGILGDLPGPKLRLGNLGGDVAVLHSGSTVVMHGTDGDAGPPGDAERLPVQWEGFARAVAAGRPDLPRRRAGSAQGRRRRRRRGHRRGRGRRRGQLPPGRQPAGRRRPPARDRRRGPRTGSTSPASTGSTCSPSRSCAARPTSRPSAPRSRPTAPTSR